MFIAGRYGPPSKPQRGDMCPLKGASPIVINRRQEMNFENIFTVRNDDLGRLNERTAVEVFQKLLWAEARRIGLEVSKINVSNQIKVPDHGIDATVDETQIATGNETVEFICEDNIQ